MNLTNALGWTLLHFLWQGASIALLLAGALLGLRRAGSRRRYAASAAALLLMLACATATFVKLKTRPRAAELAATAASIPTLSTEPQATATASGSTVSDYVPALVWAWLGGVIALSIRALGGWVLAERFARCHTWRAEAAWDERLALLAKRLGISRPMRLAVSGMAQVPAVVGWLRPIVLMPATIFTGLPAEQIEALLAHELAHIRRHDYLVNLLQTATETLLFYHPAVWWVSRRIRTERENCCDDLAVEVSGDTITYVRALTELEQMRQGTPRLAMAADGGSLFNRIQRLLRVDAETSAVPSGWLAGIGIAACLCIGGVAAKGVAAHPEHAAASPQRSREALLVTRDAAESVKHALIKPKRGPAMLLAQQRAAAPPDQTPKADEKRAASGWLDEIEAEGYRNLSIDQLVALKIHGVDGEYIRKLRGAGQQPTAEQLIAFRIHGVTADFINELRQAGLRDLKAEDLVALKIHGADPGWIRQMQALGFSNLSAEKIVALRIHGVTPEFIREAQKHFKDIDLDQIIQLKQFGILNGGEII